MFNLFQIINGGPFRPELVWIVELVSVAFSLVLVVMILNIITPWKRRTK